METKKVDALLKQEFLERHKLREFVYRLKDCQTYWWTSSIIDAWTKYFTDNPKEIEQYKFIIEQIEDANKKLNEKVAIITAMNKSRDKIVFPEK